MLMGNTDGNSQGMQILQTSQGEILGHTPNIYSGAFADLATPGSGGTPRRALDSLDGPRAAMSESGPFYDGSCYNV